MRYIVLILAALTSACIPTSGSPSNDPLATSPYGVAGEIITRDSAFTGELLTVTPADLTLLSSDRRVLVVPYSIVERGNFSAIDVHIAHEPSARHLDQLRNASRFPYGIPAPAMRAMLAKAGRPAPDTLKAP